MTESVIVTVLIVLVLTLLFSLNLVVTLEHSPKCLLLAEGEDLFGAVWPKPNFMNQTQPDLLHIDPQVKFTGNVENEIISNAINRYKDLIFGKLQVESMPTTTLKSRQPNIFQTIRRQSSRQTSSEPCLNIRSTSISEIHFLIHDTQSLDITLDSSEKYSIQIDGSNRILIESDEVWGSLRALETLSQLIRPAVSSSQDSIFVLPYVSIKDYPRFQWRGILIDVSRHYLTPKRLLKIVDALSYQKFNVLHLHLSDAQSFPLETIKYSLLSKKGAWADGFIYTHTFMKELSNYARLRGMRVVPEFDVPGHTYSWGLGYPDATASCPGLMKRTKNINNVPLNMAHPIVDDIISSIIDEYKDVFTDKFIHFGGDEVVQSCWREDDSITRYMKDHNLKTYDDFEADFENRLEKIYSSHDKEMICWQELAQLNSSLWSLPKSSIIQIWKSPEDLGPFMKKFKDNRFLLSAGWYLDKAVPIKDVQPPYLWGDSWKTMYELNPTDYLNTSNERSQLEKNLIGGEACQWGEQVDDDSIEQRIWPRVSAVAERLWGWVGDEDSSEKIDIKAVEKRLIQHRCDILVRRGVRAFPLRPDFCPWVYKNFE